MSYYQLGGWRGHVNGLFGGYDQNALAEAIAGEKSPLRSPTDGRVELILGILRSGASNVLITAEQVRQLGKSIKLSNRPPCRCEEYESLSPINLSLLELVKTLSRHKTKNTGAGRGTDNSQANRSYVLTNGADGVIRAAFEHSRVLYRIWKKDLDLQKFGLDGTLTSTPFKVYSLVFNAWNKGAQTTKERLENPKILDIGWSQFVVPGLESKLGELGDSPSTTHLVVSENKALGQGTESIKNEFHHGDTEILDHSLVSTRVSQLFENTSQSSDPLILLVNGEEKTRYALQTLGVDIRNWTSDLKSLLRPLNGEQSIRRPARASGSSQYPYSGQIVRKRSRSLSPHSPLRYTPHRNSYHSRARSPVLSYTESARDHKQKLSHVYLIDVQGMYVRWLQTSKNTESVQAMARSLGLATDWILKWYQPYVTLAKGNATAEESLLLQYIALPKFMTLFYSYKFKHRLVFVSSLTALATLLLQPLAGSILQIKQLPYSHPTTLNVTSKVGVDPDSSTLAAFAAAAGFVQAAVYNNLSYPPFTLGGWATTEFVFPADPGLSGSLALNTTAILNNPVCSMPTTSTLGPETDGIATFSATSQSGCSAQVAINTTNANARYGVSSVPNCNTASSDVQFSPVMFWFFQFKADNTPEAQAVFCSPTIQAFNVEITAALNNASITSVSVFSAFIGSSNFNETLALNGVIFDPSTDPIVQGRAVATNAGVPGAIYQYASQLSNGPQSTFDQQTGFLDITTQVYTEYLALLAKSVYFTDEQHIQVSAVLTSLTPRLWIEPLSGHALSFILFMIGVVGIVVHIIHRRARRKLWLTSAPGSIAGTVSLTSRSGFGDLLLPYDDDESMKKKLAGLKFRLDERTGAILAEDDTVNMGPDDAMLTLLGRKRERSSYRSSISTFPTEPWEPPEDQPLKTPYDP